MNFASGMQIGGQDATFGGMRNRIINGDMRIYQRGASANTNGSLSVDRFPYEVSGSGVISHEQSTDAPDGFTNSIKYTVTTVDSSISSAEYYQSIQRIEGLNISDVGLGKSWCKTLTFSCWVKASQTGTYSIQFANVSGSRCYPSSITINASNTWEYKTVSIPVTTSGTFATDNTEGFAVRIGFAYGSNFTGATPNTWGTFSAFANSFVAPSNSMLATNGATFFLTGVQLEKGSAATAFENRQYGQELALCQRYYTTLLNGNDKVLCNAFAWSTNEINGTIFFPVSMRTNPTLSFVSGAYYYFDKSGGTLTLPSPYFTGIFGVNLTSACVYNSSMVGTAPAAGYSGTIRTNNSLAFVALTAEL
jgi:hypothetical protein